MGTNSTASAKAVRRRTSRSGTGRAYPSPSACRLTHVGRRGASITAVLSCSPTVARAPPAKCPPRGRERGPWPPRGAPGVAMTRAPGRVDRAASAMARISASATPIKIAASRAHKAPPRKTRPNSDHPDIATGGTPRGRLARSPTAASTPAWSLRSQPSPWPLRCDRHPERTTSANPAIRRRSAVQHHRPKKRSATSPERADRPGPRRPDVAARGRRAHRLGQPALGYELHPRHDPLALGDGDGLRVGRPSLVRPPLGPRSGDVRKPQTASSTSRLWITEYRSNPLEPVVGHLVKQRICPRPIARVDRDLGRVPGQNDRQ